MGDEYNPNPNQAVFFANLCNTAMKYGNKNHPEKIGMSAVTLYPKWYTSV